MKYFNQNLNLRRLAYSAIFLSLISCVDTSYFDRDIEDINVNLNVEGIPLGYITYTAEDIFKEIGNDLQVGSSDDNGESVISFNYTQSLDGSDNTDFVSIDNQELKPNDSDHFELFDESPFPGGVSEMVYTSLIPDLPSEIEKSFTKTESIKKDGADIIPQLTSINFNTGKLSIEIIAQNINGNEKPEAEMDITFSIPSLISKNDNSQYQHTFKLNDHSIDKEERKTSDEDVISLSDYEFDLTIASIDKDTGIITRGAANNIASKLDLLVKFADGDKLSTENEITYIIKFTGDDVNDDKSLAELKDAKGDFKQESLTLNNETFNLDFFEELGDVGSITFENPILNISATNEFGFPIGLALGKISTDATNNNLLIIDESLASNVEANADEPTLGDYAIFAKGTIANPITTNIKLDDTNCNLAEILKEKPTKFNLNVSATTNPNSESGNVNVFEFGSEFNVNVDIELPLHVTFDNIDFSPDPFELDIEFIDNIDEYANTATIQISSRNSTPLSGDISLEFVKNYVSADSPGEIIKYTNANNVEVDFVKALNLLEGAPVDSNGFSEYTLENGVLKQGTSVIAPTISNLELTNEEILALKEVTHIRPVVKFNTTNKAAAKLRTNDQLRLDIGIKGDAILDLSDDDEDNN